MSLLTYYKKNIYQKLFSVRTWNVSGSQMLYRCNCFGRSDLILQHFCFHNWGLPNIISSWFYSFFYCVKLFNCFGHYFCLHFEAFRLGTEPVYMAFLRFMGEESDARKFGYCLEVGGDGRKLIWQGVPRSIRTHHRSIRDSHDGLIVQRSLALAFSGGDRKELKLRVTGRIWKELWKCEKPSHSNCIYFFSFLCTASLWEMAKESYPYRTIYALFDDGHEVDI